jgi:hypothetical protein
MIPANPRSILVCEGTLGSTSSSYRSALITQGFQGLVAALNALPTKRSTASCQGDGNQEVFYELLSNYVQGPSVIVTVDPHCAPSIDNHSLQSDDSSSIVPLIQRLIR